LVGVSKVVSGVWVVSEDGGSTVHTMGTGAGSGAVRLGVFAHGVGVEVLEKARDVALRMGVGFFEGEPTGELCDLAVMVGAGELGLLPMTGPRELTHGHAVKIDWSGIDVTSGAGRSWDQPILKAVGLKSRSQTLCVVDGTAGLGEDAFVMASFGARVVMIERGAVVAVMLEEFLVGGRKSSNVLRPASSVEELKEAEYPHPSPLPKGEGVRGRMSVVHADAGAWLTEENIRGVGADVVYLDFMFPGGRKTAERKPMKVLRMLAGGDDDAGAVLEKAIASGVKRVVVKRPGKAPFVGGLEPSHAIYGKSLRFDVYMKKGLGSGV
jgi:16S rRNA (guanine1516-N2)-methyltransferase